MCRGWGVVCYELWSALRAFGSPSDSCPARFRSRSRSREFRLPSTRGGRLAPPSSRLLPGRKARCSRPALMEQEFSTRITRCRRESEGGKSGSRCAVARLRTRACVVHRRRHRRPNASRARPARSGLPLPQASRRESTRRTQDGSGCERWVPSPRGRAWVLLIASALFGVQRPFWARPKWSLGAPTGAKVLAETRPQGETQKGFPPHGNDEPSLHGTKRFARNSS